MMRRTLLALLPAALIATFAFAQVVVVPGTPEQVNRALAEAPGSWADEAIELLVSRGLFIGYPDGTFEWREETSRAEMAMVIARLITAYNLDQFDPSEIAVLREAADRLSGELQGAHDLLLGQGNDIAELARGLDRNEAEIAELRDALSVLDVAPEQFDATDLWNSIRALEDAQGAARADIDSLREQLSALPSQPQEADTSAIESTITELEQRIGASQGDVDALSARLDDLANRVDAAAGLTPAQAELLEGLDSRIGSMQDQLDASARRMDDLTAEFDHLSDTVAAQGERIDRLESALLPDRAPFYVSLAVYGSSPDHGLMGQVTVGYDAVIENLGVRVSADFGFDDVPISVAGGVTYRATMGNIDGYAGVGGGVRLEEPDPAAFGELLVGANLRLFRNLGLFAEARYRPLFNGSGDSYSAVFGGIQVRF